MLLQGSRVFIRQALAVLACAMVAASAAQAAEVERWRMATEYPATAMPGEGAGRDSTFIRRSVDRETAHSKQRDCACC
ncbi:hypothetical protein LMG9673_00480 [Ralstonia pseudosolanacearum]|nr:hypothetical protein LMG9673_00480 [Ralstonia pseudosolanacearum]